MLSRATNVNYMELIDASVSVVVEQGLVILRYPSTAVYPILPPPKYKKNKIKINVLCSLYPRLCLPRQGGDYKVPQLVFYAHDRSWCRRSRAPVWTRAASGQPKLARTHPGPQPTEEDAGPAFEPVRSISVFT